MGQSAAKMEAGTEATLDQARELLGTSTPVYVLGECFDEEIGDDHVIAMTGAEYKEILSIFQRQLEEIEALEHRIKTLLER